MSLRVLSSRSVISMATYARCTCKLVCIYSCLRGNTMITLTSTLRSNVDWVCVLYLTLALTPLSSHCALKLLYIVIVLLIYIIFDVS